MMSFASRPVKISSRIRVGSTRQASGCVHGMWMKWCRKTSGRARRTRSGQRVEVVVVDHHHRFARALDLLDDGAREVFVDDVVAELERLDLLAADVRRVREVPQVVLDEPQHRVGEHVVEAVVGLRVADDQAHLVLAAGGRAHRERAAAVLARDLGVVLVHRRGDPDRVAVRGEPRQRRHQPAGAALDLAVGVERDGPAVAHQHQRRPLCRRPRSCLSQLVEDPQVVAQVARRQEVLAHVLLAAPPERAAELGVAQDLERALRALPRRSRRESR